MICKVVYEDGDNIKVARGQFSEDEQFVRINNLRINKTAIISIKELTE